MTGKPAKSLEKCMWCGAAVQTQPAGAPTKFGAHPGCFALFGQVIAREFQDAAYFSVHRLTVDCYAVQHPGAEGERAMVQSHNIHLMAIYLDRVLGLANDDVVQALKRAATKGKGRFLPLAPPPADAYRLNIADVLAAGTAAAHKEMVRAWTDDVWHAWRAHHATAKELAALYGGVG